jgi:hypothetical protein
LTSNRERPATTSEQATAENTRLERWERERSLGRGKFILRRGVAGWGIPVAFAAVLYKLVQEQGFVRSPVLTPGLQEAIAISFVVFPLCGYIFGRWLWNEGEAWYQTRTRDSRHDRSARR